MYGRSRTNVTSLNFYVYARPFIHCLYFIYARKFYLRRHVKLRDSGNPPLGTSAMSPPLDMALCRKKQGKRVEGRKVGLLVWLLFYLFFMPFEMQIFIIIHLKYFSAADWLKFRS